MKPCLMLPSLALFALVVFTSVASFAGQKVTIDGYSLDLYWKQSRDVVELSGTVEKGQKCSQLNISVFLRNSGDGSLAHFEVFVKDYLKTGASRRNFKGADKVYTNQKKSWHIDSIYTNCL